MRFVFRTDASTQIGSGHVIRCLTLADELTRHGHQCRFVCREHAGHLGHLIAGKGYELALLTDSQSAEQQLSDRTGNAHADWLGVTWQYDSAQTLEVLSPLQADWLVVDHYALDSRWERLVAKAVGRIMVIDDLADRPHQVDLLLDQNVLGSEMEQRYKAKVNSDCRLLLGPKYALLGREYGLLAEVLPERDGQVSRILVFVGGSDPHHLTEKYLNALNASEFRHLLVDVVIGRNHPSAAVVSDLVASRKGARLYSWLPSLSTLMIRADLMLGAGGATNWERICLGLNAIVVSVAGNQESVNRELAETGLLTFLDKAQYVTVEMVSSYLRKILADSEGNRKKSEIMRQVVDGKGCQRVMQAIHEHV